MSGNSKTSDRRPARIRYTAAKQWLVNKARAITRHTKRVAKKATKLKARAARAAPH